MDFELSDEQRMWREAVHDFVAREVKPRAHEVDEEARFNWEATRKMGPLGLLGLNAPEEYGGAGVDPVSAAIAIEELGWAAAAPPWRSPRIMGWAARPLHYLAPRSRRGASSCPSPAVRASWRRWR